MFRSRLLLRTLLLLIAVTLTVLVPLLAQPAKEGRRYALLVGVRQYAKNELTELEFADRDVEELARVFLDGGYAKDNVIVMTQERGARDIDLLPTGAQIREQLKLLLQGRTDADSVVVAFAGHGVQFKESEDSYFCPADARLDRLETLIPLKEVYAALKDSKAGAKLLLVDACRNNPVPKGSRSAERLESVTRPQKTAPPGGVAALFSCSAGQKAYENSTLKHGVFFHFVIKGLQGEAGGGKRPDVTLSELVAYVEREVPDFVRVEHKAGQVPELVGQTRGGVPLITLKDNRTITNSIGMALVLVPAGKFTMGSPKGEEGRGDSEEQHAVEITKSFCLGKYEVTRGQFRAFARDRGYQTEAEKADDKESWQSPFLEQTDEHPVVYVSWNDAVAFCDWLSKKEGKKYRLPTEAEWEYGCRAKTTTRFHSGESEDSLKTVAHCNPNPRKTVPVGRFKPNAFGLYDMHGNVHEWCQDWYDENYYKNSPRQDPQGPGAGSFRVIRGGSFSFFPRFCRAAGRYNNAPSFRYYDFGFRVLLVR